MIRLEFPEKIETSRLLLQRLRYEDAEEIFYTYASKPEVTTYLSWPTHQRIEDTVAFVRYAVRSWDLGLDYTFSIRLKPAGKFIGSLGVINDDGKIQFGYAFSPTAWGKGFATEACSAVLPILKRSAGVYRVGTFVDAENVQSIRVLQKCGLVEEARLERWFRFINQGNRPKDCILFRLPLQPA